MYIYDITFKRTHEGILYLYKYGCGYSAKMLEFRLKAIIMWTEQIYNISLGYSYLRAHDAVTF